MPLQDKSEWVSFSATQKIYIFFIIIKPSFVYIGGKQSKFNAVNLTQIVIQTGMKNIRCGLLIWKDDTFQRKEEKLPERIIR